MDCMDPDNKAVPVNLTDNFDGTYRLRAKPVKPGKHTVNIKLNKHHVLGKSGSLFLFLLNTDKPTYSSICNMEYSMNRFDGVNEIIVYVTLVFETIQSGPYSSFECFSVLKGTPFNTLFIIYNFQQQTIHGM